MYAYYMFRYTSLLLTLIGLSNHRLTYRFSGNLFNNNPDKTYRVISCQSTPPFHASYYDSAQVLFLPTMLIVRFTNINNLTLYYITQIEIIIFFVIQPLIRYYVQLNLIFNKTGPSMYYMYACQSNGHFLCIEV